MFQPCRSFQDSRGLGFTVPKPNVGVPLHMTCCVPISTSTIWRGGGFFVHHLRKQVWVHNSTAKTTLAFHVEQCRALLDLTCLGGIIGCEWCTFCCLPLFVSGESKPRMPLSKIIMQVDSDRILNILPEKVGRAVKGVGCIGILKCLCFCILMHHASLPCLLYSYRPL